MKNIKPVKCSILDLPSEILSKILSLLPTKSIMSCKSVCKFWCSTIRNQDFKGSSKSFALIVRRDGDNRSTTNLHVVEPEIDYAVKKNNGNLCLVLGKKSVTRFNDGNFDGYHIAMLKIVNSCEGLVCLTISPILLSSKWNKSYFEQWAPFFVCNPVTSDYVVVNHPRSTEVGLCVEGYAGFGFSSRSRKYKLLRFLYDGLNKDGRPLLADLYTLGVDETWRNLDNRPPQGYHWCDKGTFFKGSLHWIITHKKTLVGGIAVFDCQEEIFVLMDLPNSLSPDCMVDYELMELAILQDQLCFCISNIVKRNDCEIWIMDKYGVQESWRKLFVISSGESPDYLMPFKPFAYLKNGEILMLSVKSALVSYNVRSNTWRAVKVPGVTAKVDAMLFDLSFVPTQKLLMQGEPENAEVTE